MEGGEELEDMTPWSPTSSRIFGLIGGELIGAFSLAAVVAFLARGRVLSCLLGRLCPRAVDGLAAQLGEAATRAMTEAEVARVERLMRAAPRRTESKEKLRRLPISPASSPESSDVEEEDEEEVDKEPMDRAHVDAARLPLFPRPANEAGPVLDPADL